VEKFIKRRNIQRILELECLRLERLDKRFDLSIGKHVIENFQHTRLFHTVKHPAVELIFLLVTELLSKVSLPFGLSRPLIDSLDYYQIPVHPTVAKTLDVKWARPDLTYKVLGENMTFESYTRRYIDEYG
jgi:hypothetical protein